MAGVTKHIYNHEIIEIKKMWCTQLKTIEQTLPKNYTKKDILEKIREFYPHEWQYVICKYEYYCKKDQFLQRRQGKNRYSMVNPEVLLTQAVVYKKFMSKQHREAYAKNYSVENQKNACEDLWRKRAHKINRVNQKIKNAQLKTQQVTPDFLDKLIGLYQQKKTSQMDKVYILLELKKYYCPKIIQFFLKLNDTELNQQLRLEAFEHLQSFSYKPRLRKQKYMKVHTKNRKRKNFLKHDV